MDFDIKDFDIKDFDKMDLDENDSEIQISDSPPLLWDTTDFRHEDGNEFPSGWAYDEDLGEDIEALIERYTRRINQNIAPEFFKRKIEELDRLREAKE